MLSFKEFLAETQKGFIKGWQPVPSWAYSAHEVSRQLYEGYAKDFPAHERRPEPKAEPGIRDEIAALRAELRAAVKTLLGEGVDDKNCLITSLTDRIDALEQRPSLEYKGTWRPDTSYTAGSAVTSGGSLWIAEQATHEKPGNGATAWRLAVKRGRDGRKAGWDNGEVARRVADRVDSNVGLITK